MPLKHTRLRDVTVQVLGVIDAINLLGSSHFKCPLKSCGMVVSLRSFNNMRDITCHLSQHKRKGKGVEHDRATCCVAESDVSCFHVFIRRAFYRQKKNLELKFKIK